MFRFSRKSIYCRWHANHKNFPDKKHQNCTKPKALISCGTSSNQNHSDQDHQKKQHADRQQYWDDPQFRFCFFRASIFETAGWLGTAALCFNYHVKYIGSILEHERIKSSCLFSNIAFAMPRRNSENEKSVPITPNSTSQIVHDSENDELLNDNILEDIKSLSIQYTAALENSAGINNINNNDKKAFRFFQNAARHGSITGFYNLGLCYELGKGTKVNLNRAAFCYKRAAMKGHGLASFNLATFFYKGIGGLPVDFKIAKELLAEAAEKGVSEAQLYFGLLFLEEKRWEDAVRIFSSLAVKNVSHAQYYLGLCYENGLGVKQNEKIAVELFTKSAYQGNKRAFEKLQNNRRNRNDIQHFLKTPVVKDIEQSNKLHVSVSVPELSAVLKETNQTTRKFPLLSYLDLYLLVKNNISNIKDKFCIDEKKLSKDYSNTFIPFKTIPLVMQVKTQL